MADQTDGFVTIADLFERYVAEEAVWWTCPITGKDCRGEEKPALGLHGEDGSVKIYATWSLAADNCDGLIECQRGMTARWILDNWLHYAEKMWIDHGQLNAAVRRISAHFGDGSWSGVCRSQNPLC